MEMGVPKTNKQMEKNWFKVSVEDHNSWKRLLKILN